jgi:hypothetical protein
MLAVSETKKGREKLRMESLELRRAALIAVRIAVTKPRASATLI